MTPLAERRQGDGPRLSPEKVAYWYFRLNGFLQIENFVVHPRGRGAQRTDADLLAVRFPHRAEFLLDHPDQPMVDDIDGLTLSSNLIEIAIVEVKTNQPCTLNGPWTREDRRNVHRVLAAIGCLPQANIHAAATGIYQAGHHQAERLRIRLIAVGRDRDEQLANDRPMVVQLTWLQILHFIWHRFHQYRHQKKQVDQWDPHGLRLKRLADSCRDVESFAGQAYASLGLQRGE